MACRKRLRPAEGFSPNLEHGVRAKAVKVRRKVLDKMDQENLYVITAYLVQ